MFYFYSCSPSSHTSSSHSQHSLTKSDDLYVNDEPPPKILPLRPIIRGPYSENGDDDDHSSETTIVYTEQHTEVKLNCEVDLDIAAVVWMHNGQVSSLISHVYCYLFAHSFFPTIQYDDGDDDDVELANKTQKMMKYDIFSFFFLLLRVSFAWKSTDSPEDKTCEIFCLFTLKIQFTWHVSWNNYFSVIK